MITILSRQFQEIKASGLRIDLEFEVNTILTRSDQAVKELSRNFLNLESLMFEYTAGYESTPTMLQWLNCSDHIQEEEDPQVS